MPTGVKSLLSASKGKNKSTTSQLHYNTTNSSYVYSFHVISSDKLLFRYPFLSFYKFCALLNSPYTSKPKPVGHILFSPSDTT